MVQDTVRRRAEKYRARAGELRGLGATMKDQTARFLMLSLAQRYERLAASVERFALLRHA